MLTPQILLCRHFVATDERCLHTGAWRPRQMLCQPFGLCSHAELQIELLNLVPPI